MMCDSVDALLFDLGNVVIEIDFNRAIAHWAAHARCEESLIRERFRHDHAYDQYERGRIDFDAYFSTLRTNLGVDISDPQLRDGWNAILIGASARNIRPVGERCRALPALCAYQLQS